MNQTSSTEIYPHKKLLTDYSTVLRIAVSMPNDLGENVPKLSNDEFPLTFPY